MPPLLLELAPPCPDEMTVLASEAAVDWAENMMSSIPEDSGREVEDLVMIIGVVCRDVVGVGDNNGFVCCVGML